MIVIKIVSGPHAGKERVIWNGIFAGVQIDPAKLLGQHVKLGSVWEIDFSHADESEIIDWGRADMVSRIVRALLNGRMVEFQGKRYQAQSPAEVGHVAGEVEDAIVTCGYYVAVARDDEQGVVIEIAQREHRLQ